MRLEPFVLSWIAMGIVVLGLAIYRMTVASHEDDTLHVADKEARLVQEQTQTFAKIRTIDRWGQVLTIVVLVYGLLIAGIYLYHVWLQSGQIPNG